MIPWMIWRKQRTFPNRLLCFTDVTFTCQGKLGEFMPASTIFLALVEEKSTPLNFLYFSTQLSLKILAKQSKTAKKCLHFTVELFNLVYFALVRVTRRNRCLSKLVYHRRRDFYCIVSLVIFYTFFHEDFGESALTDRRYCSCWPIVCNTYLFGRAKTGGLGQLTTKKNGYY